MSLLTKISSLGKNVKLDAGNEKFTFDEIDSPIINVTTFKNSYVNIVTETDFSDDVIHITEKSLKPFYYYQLPIFVAPHNHLSELRKIYGFDMFDDIIDFFFFIRDIADKKGSGGIRAISPVLATKIQDNSILF